MLTTFIRLYALIMSCLTIIFIVIIVIVIIIFIIIIIIHIYAENPWAQVSATHLGVVGHILYLKRYTDSKQYNTIGSKKTKRHISNVFS